jgi:hypothetical protein
LSVGRLAYKEQIGITPHHGMVAKGREAAAGREKEWGENREQRERL